MGQLVYPTWAALSPSGEGSRHGRNGLGEGPRQAGQVFRRGVVDVRHASIRAPVPHEPTNEARGGTHSMGEGCTIAAEAVSREHGRVQANLAQAVPQGLDEPSVREGGRSPATRGHRECRCQRARLRADVERSDQRPYRVENVAKNMYSFGLVHARMELVGFGVAERESDVRSTEKPRLRGRGVCVN
jgi:hypothetical protein